MLLHSETKIDPQDILKGHSQGAGYIKLFTAKTLAKLACTGEHKIPKHKVGRQVIYLKSELDTWLAFHLSRGNQ